jgi:hypothetical protein
MFASAITIVGRHYYNKPNRTPAATAAMAATTPDLPCWGQTSNHIIAPQNAPNHAAVKTKLNPKLAK